jgi:2,3,4,5-tetrahydropyridine-2-carboxylate N-succinyltransferase
VEVNISLGERIESLWREEHTDTSCISEAMALLDSGKLRIASRESGHWVVHEYLKKALLLFFKHTSSVIVEGDLCNYFDKIPPKTKGWSEKDFAKAKFRAVPGCTIRYGAHIGQSVVVMPAFVNTGAFVDDGTMIDSNALIGSCAQIGKNCHISDAVTIGGVIEPLQAAPVIIEDNCFVGVKSALAEGIILEEGVVLAAGVCLTGSTRIVDRETGAIAYGRVPAYSVVVPGTYSSGNIGLCCAVVVKKVTEQTRRKTAINELLRL